MRSSVFQVQLRAIFVIIVASLAIASSHAQNPTHVVTGTIEKVDAGAKTVAVKTADGTVETVKFTDKTTVHGLKDAAKGADLVGKEGGHVIVHTTGEAAKKTPIPSDGSATKRSHPREAPAEVFARGTKPLLLKLVMDTTEPLKVPATATW